ncbi:uncharacterized protein VICG_00812 [Vittaforma corneae ATCC 50505]|uniref:mRNA-capping enzyme subunit beta n=1 Tax=Vittaforma corneae (strain ATCC 50505) TaxID=993615 RepID=L2GNI8_VITCO|nr:uncharacterized protein VICG_00812 [Vittaforma corneae ATCC 50505]ELA42169.1 hypothetical protein VICG_00812 [Vittaforma corneae ATCC 50505]
MALPNVLFCTKHEFFKKLIYKHLKLPSFKEIEIEARLGRITNLITKKRINYQVEHPIVFSRLPNELCFENGVDKQDFAQIKNTIMEGQRTNNICDKVTICNKIRRIESPEGTVYEKKVRLSSFDIYLPEFKYDIRISVSKETKAEARDFFNAKNPFTRTRERVSCQSGPFSFDFTKASKGMENGDSKVFEVEMELKDPDIGLDGFVDILFNLPVIKR